MNGVPPVRVHPFDLVFAGFRAERLPAIHAELGEQSDLDTFMLTPAAVDLMHELRPDEGLGDAVDDFVALVHAAYLYWRDGERTSDLDERNTRALCVPLADAEPARAGPSPERARYIQVAPQLIWGRLAEDGPFEPLDGWFDVPSGTGLRMVACFGVHPERPGMSVAAVAGSLPAAISREDGTPLFAPTMPGGDLAGLHAISGPEELLLLGFRARRGEEMS
ncbi:MAG TPA: hypothetical protein VID74_07980 [Gemmatimonadales bacterium]|jgi:hypothetical protein